MKNFLLLILLLVFMCNNAQTLVEGTLKDAESGEVLAFVNIGIKNKNLGALSTDKGAFSMIIPALHVKDSLSFSLIGYHSQSICIQDFVKTPLTILLKKKITALQEVEVSGKGFREKKYGIAKSKPRLKIVDASIQQADIFEIAQLIRLSNKATKIKTLSLLINESRSDSANFRINFYKCDGSGPTEQIQDLKLLYFTKAIKEGWLEFDLSKYNIYLKGEVIAAIEFLPSKTKTTPVKYEVKLGGTSRSFLRTASMGSWTTPPHHYRMYLTVLEDTETLGNHDNEKEEENRASKKLYSAFVQDTFSLFVHLPTNYKKSQKKKCPVIFLLDANVYYDLVTQSVERLAHDKKIIEPILIGIGYRDFLLNDSLRNRDYTYPTAIASDSFALSGGGLRFLEFLQNELYPYVKENYGIDTNQISLMGHSLGGYFTLFAALQEQKNKTSFFKNYLAASPSLEYANSYLFSEFKNLSSSASPERNLLLSIGSLEAEDYKNFLDFSDLLLTNKFKSIRLQKVEFSGADHMGAAVPAFDKGLEVFLKQSKYP